MSDEASPETSSENTSQGASPSDNSLRNFVVGLLVVSAAIIALAYFLQNAAG